MKSIAIDPRTGNFARENGRMRYTKTELEFMAQVVRHELSLFLGEWFLAIEKGLPYLPQSPRKAEHRFVLESALRAKLISINGVEKLIRLTISFDKRERLFDVSFCLKTIAGELESIWYNTGVTP